MLCYLVVVKCVSLQWKKLDNDSHMYYINLHRVSQLQAKWVVVCICHCINWPFLCCSAPHTSTLSDDEAPLTRRLMVVDIVLHGVHYGMLGAWYL